MMTPAVGATRAPVGGRARWPRGPAGTFLIGHLGELRRDQLGFLTRITSEYGDFVPLRLGVARGVFLSNPDHIDQVLVGDHKSYAKMPAMGALKRLLGLGLLSSEGDFWRQQRRLIQPAFHRERITGYGEIMVRHAQRWLATWRDGEVRDVRQEMMRLSMGILSEALLGADMARVSHGIAKALDEAGDHLVDRLYSLKILIPENIPTPSNVRFELNVRRLDAIIDALIAQRRREGTAGRTDLLSMLVDARDEDGNGLSDQQLRDEVMTIFLAGEETTSLSLVWAFYLLANHPAAERRLHEELDSVLGSRAPQLRDLTLLPYTQAVISESLRLYPPTWSTGRRAIRDTQIGDYPIPRDTVLLMSPWINQRDPRYFENPTTFLPERWLDGLARRLPRFAYYPFGGGPRLCIGNTFATVEAQIVLATVAHRHRLTIALGHRVVLPKQFLTLKPKDGMPMQLHDRA